MKIGIATVLFSLAMAVPAEAKKPLRVKLRFSPQENVTAAVPNMDQASTTRPIQVLSLTDERTLEDKTLIGENRESDTPVPVYALSSVADFATEALRTSLLGWGVKIAPDAELILKGAVVTLFVTEGNTYVANARIRFRLESRAGESLWEGVATGDARRWGRSLSADNYNEEISDALKKAYADLLSNKGLQDAWAGVKNSGPARTSISPTAMKEKPLTNDDVIGMVKAGLGDELTIAKIKQAPAVDLDLSADALISLKKAGASKAVIDAMMKRAARPKAK